MQPLLQGEAAVGGQNLAGDEIRIGGGQEADDFGHVFRSADPPQGVSCARDATVSFPRARSMSESMQPGATALTRIPEGASSAASDLVSPTSAALVAGVSHLAGGAVKPPDGSDVDNVSLFFMEHPGKYGRMQ